MTQIFNIRRLSGERIALQRGTTPAKALESFLRERIPPNPNQMGKVDHHDVEIHTIEPSDLHESEIDDVVIVYNQDHFAMFDLYVKPIKSISPPELFARLRLQ